MEWADFCKWRTKKFLLAFFPIFDEAFFSSFIFWCENCPQFSYLACEWACELSKQITVLIYLKLMNSDNFAWFMSLRIKHFGCDSSQEKLLWGISLKREFFPFSEWKRKKNLIIFNNEPHKSIIFAVNDARTGLYSEQKNNTKYLLWKILIKLKLNLITKNYKTTMHQRIIIILRFKFNSR